VQPQLLVDFAPRLKGNYYTAWRGAAASSQAPQGAALAGVFLLRGGESLFGAGAAQEPTFTDKGTSFAEWRYADDETATNAFLPRADEALAAGDLVLIQQPTGVPEMPFLRQVRRAVAVATGPRSAYGISVDATAIQLAEPAWRAVETEFDNTVSVGTQTQRLPITALRKTRLHLQKAVLTLVDEPIAIAVEGQEIELGPLHEALTSGRWVIFEGERADIEGVSGVRSSELLMVAGLTHGADATLPGDRAHTTLRLATPTAYRYKRDTLRIHGNVVPASHGESRREVLGGGDARMSMQRFELRQPPLTWRPAPTAAGAQSTLKVLVNDVEWHEVDTLAGVGPEARVFVARTGDDDKTTVTFGNGIDGVRPPTGFENIRAEYRNGIGKGGNVRAGQINLLVTRPLGIKDVINPLRASGGADRETLDLIRDNAPRSTVALDRLVSLSDYADFTRMYAGIAKAHAIRLSDGGREVVHVTIAGVEDMPIDPTSDLHRNLLAALRELGDPGLAVEVAMRERIALVLQAGLRLADGHRWEPVVEAVRARLLQRFGFDARALGQPALLCEIVAAIQTVRGVAWVDVDSFGGIPETVLDKVRNRRRLITQDEITREVGRIQVGGADWMQVFGGGNNTAMANAVQAASVVRRPRRPPERVDAGYAVSEPGAIRPARLAFFAPALADTLILNRIE
jgi:predicted phage baseplate assembly protein